MVLIGLVLCLSLAPCSVSHWPSTVVPVLQVGYNSLGPEGTLALLVGVERNECSSLALLNFGVSHGQASRETNRCQTINGLALLFPFVAVILVMFRTLLLFPLTASCDSITVFLLLSPLTTVSPLASFALLCLMVVEVIAIDVLVLSHAG